MKYIHVRTTHHEKLFMHTILAHQQHVVVDLTVDDVDSGESEAVCARPGKKVKHTHEEEASAGNAISSREVVHLLQYAAAHDQKKRLWKARHATLQARVLALEAELAAAGAAAIAKKAREVRRFALCTHRCGVMVGYK